ncbi:MAG: N-acetylmuramoyl-L-alanine amidase [Thiohalomonadales bacterium]
MEINNHRLNADNVDWRESPNQGSKLVNGQPDSIIIHYTAGSSAESSVKSLSNPKQKVSAHLVVGRKGDIYQLVPFDTVAWHAGRSSWEGRYGYNKYSIGIEIDNAGILKPNGNGNYLSWFNRVYTPDEVVKATHRNETTAQYWHRYSEQQIDTVFEICETLYESYPIKELLGHEEISPSRKTDPGPAFPLDRLRMRLFDNDRQEEKPDDQIPLLNKVARVTAPLLNIRSGPDPSFDKVAEPLKQNSQVEIIDKDGSWVKVRYTTEGWVSAKYLSKL